MRNKATKKNMDLDLRRYGRNEFTKAVNSGGGNSGSSGNSGSDGELNMKEIIKNALIEMGAGEPIPDLVYPDNFFIPPSTVCKTAEDLVIGIFNKMVIPIYKDIPGNVALETPVSSEDLGEGTYLFMLRGDIDFTQSGNMYQVVPLGTEEEYYSLQMYDDGGGGGGENI